MKASNGSLTIFITLIVALILEVMPLPAIIEMARPHWVLLFLLYWTLALPNRVSIGTAFCLGFALDLLLGSTLGTHSLSMCLAVYIAGYNFQRIRNFSLWQQAFVVGLLTTLSMLLEFWVVHLSKDVSLAWISVWSVVTSMVAWPWLFLLLRRTRRQFKVR